MNETLKRIVWISAVIAIVSLGIAVLLFIAGDMGGAWKMVNGFTVDEQRSFDSSGIETVDVRSSSIDVHIAAGQGDLIEIHLHGGVTSGKTDALPVLQAGRSGEVLEITTERKHGISFGLGFISSDLILDIHLPKQYRGALVVYTRSGDVEINDQILSQLSVETSSGDMRLSSIQTAAIAMESSSGDQWGQDMKAEHSSFTSSSGDIRIMDLRGGAGAQSSSGDITLRFAEFTSDLEVQSSSGDVELYLTETAGFQVEAKSSSGDIECAFPVTVVREDGEIRRNRLNGTVGEGTHRVRVRTSSGDISILP